MITNTKTDQPYPDHPDDLMCVVRCCVERVCVDAVTGSCSGVDMIVVCVYQCHIRPLVGIDKVLSVLFGFDDQSWCLFLLSFQILSHS